MMSFKNMSSLVVAVSLLFAATLIFPQSGFVAVAEAKKTDCKSGQKWDKALNRCVEADGGY